MTTEYIVDATVLPWKDGLTEGISFRGQTLLDGLDGGPEAFRFRFDPCPSVYAHMHLTCQFQVLLGGEMDLPRESARLRPPAVHYTDHKKPYGPFSVAGEHEVLVLHPKRAGLLSMKDKSVRKEINLKARELSGMEKDVEWASSPELGGGRWKFLIYREDGPQALLLDCPRGAEISALDPPTFGRYEIVIGGSAYFGGRLLTPPGFRYVIGERQPSPITAGESGATLLLLSFDADALEGGLTSEWIGLQAEEAMAKAI